MNDIYNKMYGIYSYMPDGQFLGEKIESMYTRNIFTNLYTEQEYISGISIYNYNARFYDSSIGRFYSKDIENEFPSPYVYAGNNSIDFTDPSGESVLSGIISTVLGIGAVALGIILSPVTEGASLSLSYIGATVISGGLIGAGISSGLYGATHMNDNFNWADWGVESAIGLGAGVIANVGFTKGIKAISNLRNFNPISKMFMGGLFGAAVGGTIGFIGNGVSNSYYRKDFINKWEISVSVGSVVGLISGGILTGKMLNTSRSMETSYSYTTSGSKSYITSSINKQPSVNIINPSKSIAYDPAPFFIGDTLFV